MTELKIAIYHTWNWQANLRMDPKMCEEKRRKKVEDIPVTLGLTKCRDTLVGLPNGKIRGISGEF